MSETATVGSSRPTLAVAEEYVDALVAGCKTMTVRLPDEYDERVRDAAADGGRVLLVDPDGDPLAVVQVRAVLPTTPRLFDVGAAAAPQYASAHAAVETLRGHYPGRSIGLETSIDVVVFRPVRLLVGDEGARETGGTDRREP